MNFKNLINLFEEYPYIVAAYLFGSYAKNKAGPMSDLDIALILNKDAPTGRNLIHEEDYLAFRIAKRLGVKEVDLTHINNKGIIFQHNILRSGKLIYECDSTLRAKFVKRVIMEYCDFEPTIRFIERFHIEGIINRCNSL